MMTRRSRRPLPRVSRALGIASWAVLAFGVLLTALSPDVEDGKGGAAVLPLVALAVFFILQVVRLGMLGWTRRRRRLPLWVLAISIMLWAAGSAALNAGGQAALTQFPAPGEWLFIASYVGLAGFLLLDAGRRGAHATTTWLDVAVVCGGTASVAGAFLLTPVAVELRAGRSTPPGRPALPAHRPGPGAARRRPDDPPTARDEPADGRPLPRLPALAARRLELRRQPVVGDVQVRPAAVRGLGRRHRPHRGQRLHAPAGHRHGYPPPARAPDPPLRQLDRRAGPGVPADWRGHLVRDRAGGGHPGGGRCADVGRAARGARRRRGAPHGEHRRPDQPAQPPGRPEPPRQGPARRQPARPDAARPRRLQGHQRHARPLCRGRRPRAGGDPDARGARRRGAAGQARRRRVRPRRGRRRPCPPSRDGSAGPRRPAAADQHRRPRARDRRLGRHHRTHPSRPAVDRPAAPRRHRDVPGQGDQGGGAALRRHP